MLPSSYSEAVVLGVSAYFTGKPCKAGHVAPRDTANRTCRKCQAPIKSKWTKEHPRPSGPVPEPQRAKNRAHYHKRKGEDPSYGRRKGPIPPEQRREYTRRYLEKKPWLTKHYNAMRYAAKTRSTPKWVDKEAIRDVYRNCPEGMHVDHIVPIRGKNACGLHVPWNLQYLTPTENSRKSNKYE